MNSTRGSIAILAVAVLSVGFVRPASASASASACKLQAVNELPLVVVGDEAYVEVSINGQPARLLVDTGAFTTLLTPAAAKALGLNPLPLRGYRTWGVGGFSVPETARIRDIKLGGSTRHNFDIMVTGSIRSKAFAGLLGSDVLGSTDLEIDVADKVIRLFRTEGCQGDQVVYWNKAYSVASLLGSNREHDVPKLIVLLNGRRTVAELDSGSYRSVVTTDAARNVGVTPESVGVRRSRESVGVGGVVQSWVGVFPTLSIGDQETIKNAKLELADLFGKDREIRLGSNIPVAVDDFPGMLLGFDFIRAHRIYIARSQGKAYFSYNGGPIFELPTQAGDEPQQGDKASAPEPPGKSPE
jgi:hypothetical protein